METLIKEEILKLVEWVSIGTCSKGSAVLLGSA
jgi:hypothetical protein